MELIDTFDESMAEAILFCRVESSPEMGQMPSELRLRSSHGKEHRPQPTDDDAIYMMSANPSKDRWCRVEPRSVEPIRVVPRPPTLPRHGAETSTCAHSDGR